MNDFVEQRIARLDERRAAGRRRDRVAADRSPGPLEEICRLIAEHLGEDHPLLLPRLAELAETYRGMGECDKAEAVYRRIAFHTGAADSDPLGHARDLNALAVLRCEMGHHERATGLFADALAISRCHLPADDPGLATLLNNFASAHHSLGHYRRAEVLYRDALEIYERPPRPPTPELGHCLCDLAELLRERGDRAAALRLARRAGRSFHQSLAADCKGQARALARLASLHCASEDPWQALRLLRQAAGLLRQAGGTCDRELLRCLNRLSRRAWDSRPQG